MRNLIGVVIVAVLIGVAAVLAVVAYMPEPEVKPAMIPEHTCTLFDAYDEDYKMYLGVLKLCGPLGADKPKQMLEGEPQGIWQ